MPSNTWSGAYCQLWIRSLSKSELHALIDDVQSGDEEAILRSVAFVAAESSGIWHNRARAKICRHFKNHRPSDSQCDQMIEAIVRRLIDGRFSEQFKDQLSMAIRLDQARMVEAADAAAESDREYVRRYAEWIRNVVRTTTSNPN